MRSSPVLQSDRFISLFLLIPGLGAFLILLFLPQIEATSAFTTCPFRLLTGMPCPGCFLGRSLSAILHGNNPVIGFSNILAWPFLFSWLAGIFWVLRDAVYNEKTFLDLMKNPWPAKIRLIAECLILGSWLLNLLFNGFVHNPFA